MDHYRAESQQIMNILVESGAPVEQTSIDEAYLDVSAQFHAHDHDASLKAAVHLAKHLKKRIFQDCNLTATVGIGSNKLLAKLASDFQKPDGLTLILESQKVNILRPLRVEKIYGVGPVTAQKLKLAQLPTVGDLQDYPDDLCSVVGSFGSTLKQYSFGNDDRPLDLGDEIDSVSAMHTFQVNTADRAQLLSCLWHQAVKIADKLKLQNLGGRTIHVTVRYADFTTLPRQATLEDPISTDSDIYAAAYLLLSRRKLLTRKIRMLGLGVGDLCDPEVRQLRLLC